MYCRVTRTRVGSATQACKLWNNRKKCGAHETLIRSYLWIGLFSFECLASIILTTLSYKLQGHTSYCVHGTEVVPIIGLWCRFPCTDLYLQVLPNLQSTYFTGTMNFTPVELFIHLIVKKADRKINKNNKKKRINVWQKIELGKSKETIRKTSTSSSLHVHSKQQIWIQFERTLLKIKLYKRLLFNFINVLLNF